MTKSATGTADTQTQASWLVKDVRAAVAELQSRGVKVEEYDLPGLKTQDGASAWQGFLASSMEEAHAVVAQPGALERTVHLSFGDASGQEYVMQLIADLAIHAWDLARATGQDAALDPDTVALLLPWTEANADLVTGSGMFGPPIDAGPGAPDDVRLLGLLGRRA